MIDNDYIKTHSLEECLKEFQGANGDEKDLTPQFELLAIKMLCGGHFEVSCCGHLIRRVYLHTIEFYYHEEYGPVKDYIVYHRNPEGKGIIRFLMVSRRSRNLFQPPNLSFTTGKQNSAMKAENSPVLPTRS